MAQNLILQPSDPKHFLATIKEPVPLEALRPFLSESDVWKLGREHEDEPLRVWGITPGANDANRSKWERVHEGDLAAFTSNKQVVYWGYVTHTIINARLAEQLWGRDHKNQTWEFVYFLKDGGFDGPHMDEINPLLGYADGFFPRGVMVLAEKKAHQVIAQIGGLGSLFVEDVDPNPPSDPAHVEVIEAEVRKASTLADLEAVELKLKKWPATTEPKERVRFVRSITRNRKLARLVKMREGYRCQICGFEGFEQPSGELFAEAHHVEELAAGGSDVPSNILCVCPTCHRRIHYGSRDLVFSKGKWGFAL